jgi:uncharacterized protein YicC (UPF0701 family)
MQSMTGFGRARVVGPFGNVEAQVSCVNKRGQEIFVCLPRELEGAEGNFHELLKTSFERGKIQLTARFERGKNAAQGTQRKFQELRKACLKLKVPFHPDARLVAEILKGGSEAPLSTVAIEKAARKAALSAIAECRKSQLREGGRLEKDFRGRVEKLAALRDKALLLSKNTVDLQRTRLLKNLAQSGIALDINDERLLKELSLFADRVDIAEELTRIQSHLEAARKLIRDKGAIGRQMEFLFQELLREWNTLGNKSPRVELIRLALEAKNEIERMREQAANIV